MCVCMYVSMYAYVIQPTKIARTRNNSTDSKVADLNSEATYTGAEAASSGERGGPAELLASGTIDEFVVLPSPAGLAGPGFHMPSFVDVEIPEDQMIDGGLEAGFLNRIAEVIGKHSAVVIGEVQEPTLLKGLRTARHVDAEKALEGETWRKAFNLCKANTAFAIDIRGRDAWQLLREELLRIATETFLVEVYVFIEIPAFDTDVAVHAVDLEHPIYDGLVPAKE